jgi:hypothetical protein
LFGVLGCADGSADPRPDAVGGIGGEGGTPAELVLDAPDNEPELRAFLDAKRYTGWAKEAEAHESAGPHGDGVRVYYSPRAAAAINAGADTLPAGAAAVKELTSDGSLYGHSVWVKVQDATDSGNGFFWYEIIDQGGDTFNIYGNALGSPDCTNCHRAGKDYNLSTLPFEAADAR